MASIDDRIVNMHFNNTQFQEGIADTINSLDQLKDGLKLDGATDGINQIEKAASFFSLDNMENAVQHIADTFSLLGAIGFTVIQNLTNSALDAGKRMASSLIEPLVQGGAKRALALQQAKFQFQGLGLNIEATMASALAAVKGTAFGLDEAATAAAILGTSGVTAGNGLEQALRGIAGVAAQTGSSYSDVANIFSNISGQTRVMGQDLLSLSSRGINAAAVLAKSMGISEASVRDMVSKGKISFAQFSKAMNDAFGANAAKANELYSGALANMHAALARIGADVASPYFLGMRDIFNALGPLFDNIHEAIQPVLNDFGAFQTGAAAKLVTFINEIFGPSLIQGIKNTIVLFQTFGKIISGAFKSVFPGDFTQTMVSVLLFFQNLARAITPGFNAAGRLQRTFAGLFALFDIAVQIISSVARAFANLFGFATDGAGGILTFTARIGDFIVRIDQALKRGELFNTFFNGIAAILAVPISVLKLFFGIIGDGAKLLGNLSTAGFDNFVDNLKERFSGLAKLAQFFEGFWLGAVKVGQAVWGVIKPIFEAIGNAIGVAVHQVGEALSGLSFRDALQTVNTGIFAAFFLIIKRFMDNIFGVFDGKGTGIVAAIKNIFGQLQSNLKALQNNTNAKTLTQIAIAVALLAASAVALSLVNTGQLVIALGAMTLMIKGLLVALEAMTKITGTKGLISTAALVLMMQGIATAILLLSGSIAILAAIPLPNLIQGVTALTVVLGVFSGALYLMGKSGPQVFIAAAALALLAPALALISGVIAILGALPMDNLVQGIGALVVVLAALSLSLALLSLTGPRVLLAAAAIAVIAPSLLLLTGAVAALSALPFDNLVRGVAAFGVILLALTGSILLLSLVGPQVLLGALAIGAVALAIVPLVGAIALLSLIPLGGLIAGMAAFTVALAVLVGAVLVLGFTGPIALLGAAAIVAIALAIAVLAPALALLSAISWEGIGRLLTILSAGLGILAVMGILLIPASVGFALFGAAILLIGSGVFLAAEGIAMLSVAIVALVAVGGVGIGLLSAGIAAFISQLPALGVGLGGALVAMVVTIGEQAPKLIAAFVAILLSMLNAIDQVVPRIIDVATNIIVTLVNALVILVPLLVDAGLKILTGILTGIANNIGGIVTQALNIITNFINALANNIGQVIDAGANFVVKFIKGLGDAIRTHSADFASNGSKLFRAIVDAVANAITQGGSDLHYAGTRIGQAIFKGALASLGIRSPSRKFKYEFMPYIFSGIEEGRDDGIDRAATVGSDIGNTLGDSALSTVKKSLSSLGDALSDSDFDIQPTITPIIDMTNVNDAARQIPGLLKSPALSLDTSNDFAKSVSLQEQERNAQLVLDMSKKDVSDRPDITYIQNNNSPKALNTIELYRQTRNQLSTLKEDLDVVDQSGSS